MPISNMQEAMLRQAMADIRSAVTNATREEADALVKTGKIPFEIHDYICKVKQGDWPKIAPPTPAKPRDLEAEARSAAKRERKPKPDKPGKPTPPPPPPPTSLSSTATTSLSLGARNAHNK